MPVQLSSDIYFKFVFSQTKCEIIEDIYLAEWVSNFYNFVWCY